MTTINRSSPTSIWIQPQTTTTENSQQITKHGVITSSASVSVNISDTALALLNAESNSNEPPVEAASSGSGNDPPIVPPEKNTATQQSSGSGNDFPIKT